MVRLRVLAVIACVVGLAGCTTPASNPIKSEETSTSRPSTSVVARSSAPSAPPSNALTMTCPEFMTLDVPAKLAVAAQVIADNRTRIKPNNTSLAVEVAEAMCTHQPEETVNSALGGPPA